MSNKSIFHDQKVKNSVVVTFLAYVRLHGMSGDGSPLHVTQKAGVFTYARLPKAWLSNMHMGTREI